MNARAHLPHCPMWLAACCVLMAGCQGGHGVPCRPAYDRPFPLGQVTDSHWEAQQTNAEGSDFVFYDHEFVGDTAELNPAGKKHLLQVALRSDHVPFPVVVEQSVNNKNPKLDAARRRAIYDKLTQLGACVPDDRVVVAPAIADGITAIEGEAAYYTTLQSGGFGGVGTGVGQTFGTFGSFGGGVF